MTTKEMKELVRGPGIEEARGNNGEGERRTSGGVALPSGLWEKWRSEDAEEAERRYARFEKYKQEVARQQTEKKTIQKANKKKEGK